MLLGMYEIRVKGDGLPMNAFPPKNLVTQGIYAVLPHPIYLGFCLICLGFSLAFGSAAGLFLTTPLVILACSALVIGLERIQMKKRFGRLPDPLLGSRRLLLPLLTVFGLTRLWALILRLTERLANSWQSFRIGRIRVMNHVLFSGLAGGCGAFLLVLLAGRQHLGVIFLLMFAGVAGAALVGQLLEGSSDKLSRPFGFFGGLAGIVLAGAVISPFNDAALLVLTACTFAAPWTQAIGRLRCIMQGCCHGGPSPAAAGIVIHNRHSRVYGMANLGETPIYPTQLYSIIGNLLLGGLLIWLWQSAVPMTLLAGIYLAVSGATRFIEEGYRGEPQTKIILGLHIYQWFAIAMFLGGMIIMLFDSPAVPAIQADSLLPAIMAGVVFFVVCGLAMSVDLPDSKKKFTRLSG